MTTNAYSASFLLGALLLGILSNGSATDGWPGAPPDCWSASRVVHGRDSYEELWERNVSVRKGEKRALVKATSSPNSAYAYEMRSSKKGFSIRIESEKSHQTIIRIEDAFPGGELHWVNEKLIAGRAWWGQIAMSDFIFDVESESFLWHESATEGNIVMSQFRESCRQAGGCTCIQKEPPTD